MSNKPRIYGTCKAGCQWETVHKSDFDASASHIPQHIDEDGKCYLELGKEYKIFAPREGLFFTCWINYVYNDGVDGERVFRVRNEEEEGAGAEYFYLCDDRYAESFVFRLLQATLSADGTLTYVYELGGIRYENSISVSASSSLLAENYLYVTGATKVLLYNEDATIEAKGEDGTIITVGGEEQSTFDADTKVNVEAEMSGGYVTKAYTQASNGKVHRTNVTGCPGMTAPPGQYIVQTNANGCISCADPVNPYHAVNKQYFEANASGQKLYKHTFDVNICDADQFELQFTIEDISINATKVTWGDYTFNDYIENLLSWFWYRYRGTIKLQATGYYDDRYGAKMCPIVCIEIVPYGSSGCDFNIYYLYNGEMRNVRTRNLPNTDIAIASINEFIQEQY